MPRVRCDITGQKKGEWTAIRPEGRHRDGSPLWLVRCSCGTELHIKLSHWRNSLGESCRHHAINTMFKEQGRSINDLEGAKFGKFTILSKVPYIKRSYSWVKAKCECGCIDEVKVTDIAKQRRDCCRRCAQRRTYLEAKKRANINIPKKKAEPLHITEAKAREKGLSYGQMQAMEYLSKKRAM